MTTGNEVKNVRQSATHAYSGRKWKAIKNSSWGEEHVSKFGDKPGYVICYNNRHGELVALASVIGQPFVSQTEIDANAKLIASSPEMLRLIEKIAMLNSENRSDIMEIVVAARILLELQF
ncbi:MAG TPA: hypothetical protein PL045_02750 [Chitinophagaceae bacterium]|nr:hypothetical protein [Chitinophagaceae bacterium]